MLENVVVSMLIALDAPQHGSAEEESVVGRKLGVVLGDENCHDTPSDSLVRI